MRLETEAGVPTLALGATILVSGLADMKKLLLAASHIFAPPEADVDANDDEDEGDDDDADAGSAPRRLFRTQPPPKPVRGISLGGGDVCAAWLWNPRRFVVARC